MSGSVFILYWCIDSQTDSQVRFHWFSWTWWLFSDWQRWITEDYPVEHVKQALALFEVYTCHNQFTSHNQHEFPLTNLKGGLRNWGLVRHVGIDVGRCVGVKPEDKAHNHQIHNEIKERSKYCCPSSSTRGKASSPKINNTHLYFIRSGYSCRIICHQLYRYNQAIRTDVLLFQRRLWWGYTNNSASNYYYCTGTRPWAALHTIHFTELIQTTN